MQRGEAHPGSQREPLSLRFGQAEWEAKLRAAHQEEDAEANDREALVRVKAA